MAARPALLRLPRTLTLHVLGAALAACSSSDPSGDAATHDDAIADVSTDAAPCSVPMQGRQCFTTCSMLGSVGDAAGLVPGPCEVYCDATGACYNAMGQITPCEVSGDGDGGTYVYC